MTSQERDLHNITESDILFLELSADTLKGR